ncbi:MULTISPECIES: DUF1853 family protein [Winogradskyella]|uniref:DUF1853 family protein n=1 Tax=Winogradskyella TaxID=286104 RepID=UPI0015C94670|nr:MULTISPECIES: DUF1853 family protein [Winogradskyella]QXP79362.1 DUF1853 family protein [Winogradskyella sp. HaHa_3_26]
MNKSTLLRYKGYVKTPSLFKSKDLTQVDLLELPLTFKSLDTDSDFKNQRLGKLVEEFVFYQLKHQTSVKWITENIQIQKEQQTIGEIDALFYVKEKPIHLEIVYKFYLYDTQESYTNPLSYWIGPNRKDALCYKLEKLKNKQFPLLYKNETKHQLEDYNINIAEVSQKLCFKAQLFLPYKRNDITIDAINEQCVYGFYISYKDISIFEAYKFYIPEKLDWLIDPHVNVEWQDFNIAKDIIEKQIKENRSPLVWLKVNNTKFEKCFITFW